MDWWVEANTLDDEEAKLAKLASFLLNLMPFWPVVRRLFISWMSRQFETEGDFLTGHWDPLSESYAEWKAIHFPGKRLLSAEGDLRRAATTPRQLATPLTLTLFIDPFEHGGELWGGKTIEPSWFQEGTGRMPARPLIFEAEPPATPLAELQAAAETYAHGILVSSGLLR